MATLVETKIIPVTAELARFAARLESVRAVEDLGDASALLALRLKS
jgi:hypothetical protein